jgi:uncharacterized protein YcfJ
MKAIILFFFVSLILLACKNNAKVESASTDSTLVSAPVSKQPVEVKKEVHYVNTQTTSESSKKKGWSGAAKGTAIGAGTGAVVGAVVSKKHGKGAIIGGVVGAGAGYLIGHHHDKKKRRTQ